MFFSNPLGAAKQERAGLVSNVDLALFYFGSLSLFLARSFGQRGGGGS